jgi:hypothetical protein
MQDGILIYYSPRLARKSDSMELDYMRVLFRGRPLMTGPEDLVASILMGRI